ncbi:hypothetical protein D6C78_05296 [Aureobasidium pullulans]|uniref:Uncharacterized protein n=1 Tax=Aureobasidium pullulans TaxID=5580 RepID=A0A4T0BQ83_AURPU|nr:hypothetical protein D6C78_05296 [Aureobasidium pullulans]
MTGNLALPAPASPNKRRRLDTTSCSPPSSVAASTHDYTADNTRETQGRHSSPCDDNGSSANRITHNFQPLTARLTFGKDASLVLVGTKGSGLSSFAVIAATALRFRLVDTEKWLVEHYGLRRSEYIKERGLNSYRKIASETLKEILKKHGTGCVLVCGPEAFEPQSQSLIRAFALTHPVVMINRDITLIRQHLGLPNSREVFQILGKSQRHCRQISNLEFFNLPESEAASPLSTDLSKSLGRQNQTLNSPSLLQNVKQDFLEFLNSVTGGASMPASSMFSPSSPSEREHSTLFSLRIEEVAREGFSSIDLDCGTDAIELVVRCRPPQYTPVDWDRISRSLQMIRRRSRASIIYHVECDRPSLVREQGEYAELLSHGLRLLPDFITIDLRCSERQIENLTNSVGQTKVIGHRSYLKGESPSWKDLDLQKQFDRAVILGCHVVRLVREAESVSEDRNCLLFQAIMASRSKLMKARFASFIYQPLHFHIFGASVDYSLSPLMHNAAFDALGMGHTYSIRQSRSLSDFALLVDETFGGASISLPFKSEILSLLDLISEPAKAIQAINTIMPMRAMLDVESADSSQLSTSCRNRAGPISTLYGDNTDWTALYTCIHRYLSPANTVRPSSSALIIGAGGMARASIYALLRMGVKNIMIWNRTYSKAIQVADHFTALSGKFNHKQSHHQSPLQSRRAQECLVRVIETLDSPWPDELAQPTIVVCTIPAHQIGDVAPPEFTIPQQWFHSRTGGVIVELSYKSSWTPLLQQAHDNAHKGWICIEPLEVLIEQGRAQFELFTGYPAPQKTMRNSILEQYVAMHVAEHTNPRTILPSPQKQ